VAALEALLALRELLGDAPQIDLVAPNRRFVYKPMAVVEPFGVARKDLFDLAEVAGTLQAELHVGSLARVERDRRELVLTDSRRIPYDAAVIAIGVERRPWLVGACAIGGDRDTEPFANVLDRLESGVSSSVAFVCPPGASWTLPLYELALLTASQLADRGIAGVELSVLTGERAPLGLFGPGVGQLVRELLADRGIALFVRTRAEQVLEGGLVLDSGRTLAVDEVVTLARPLAARVPGLPFDSEGFIPVDDHCRVRGLDGVYAVGDCTTLAVKQGGLATQQADVAAEAIAARLGARVTPTRFAPVLRAVILTGIAPIYLRARMSGASVDLAEVEAAGNALWSPATKIAGRHLGPFLTHRQPFENGHLEDVAPAELDAASLGRARDESRELALLFAEADAGAGDLDSALAWLDVVERIDGELSAAYEEKRADWRASLTSGMARSPSLQR
jgi:sulfide:quinone oxidoreductase